MSGDGDLRGYAAWRLVLIHAGVEEAGMVDELILWSWGFEARDLGDGSEELFVDPDDRVGPWVGKPEALRRIEVRARQGLTPPFAGGCP